VGNCLLGTSHTPIKPRKKEVCADNGVFNENLPQTMIKLIIISEWGFHVERENIPLDIQTIRAAVTGETRAVEKIINCYSGEIDRLCAKMKKQSAGSIKKVVARICGKLLF